MMLALYCFLAPTPVGVEHPAVAARADDLHPHRIRAEDMNCDRQNPSRHYLTVKCGHLWHKLYAM